MDYGKLIRTSGSIVWKHRFLWVLGILGGGTTVSGNALGSFGSAIGNMLVKGKQASAAIDAAVESSSPGLSPWIAIALVLAAVVLVGVFVYVTLAFRAGLMLSVAGLARAEHWTLKKSFSAGSRFVVKLFRLWLFVCLWVLLGLVLLAAPSLLVWWFVGWTSAVFVGAFLAVLMILGCIGLGFIAELAARAIVLDDVAVVQSFFGSVRLVRKQVVESLIFWLATAGLGSALWFAVIILLLPLGIVVGAVGVGLYSMLGLRAVMIYALPVGIGFGVFVAALIGWAGSFLSAFLTLGYEQLRGVEERAHHIA